MLLSLLIFPKNKDRKLENLVEEIQSGNTKVLNETLEAYKPFIAKTVSKVCKRYITESDDEFSVGLIAFNDAIFKYNHDKGSSLLSFAEVVITRRVIDFIRNQAKHQTNTVSLNSYTETEDGIYENNLEADKSFEKYNEQNEDLLRREEITRLAKKLAEFNLSFYELVQQSPKHADARKNAIDIAYLIYQDKELTDYVLDKKRLPIKLLENQVEVSRKTIERQRKYIIAMVLILTGDYIYLLDYIKGVLK